MSLEFLRIPEKHVYQKWFLSQKQMVLLPSYFTIYLTEPQCVFLSTTGLFCLGSAYRRVTFFHFQSAGFLIPLRGFAPYCCGCTCPTYKSSYHREKEIDYKRIFFSFFLWGSIISLQTLVSYWLTPSDYLWNFDPVPFFLLVLIALLLIPFQASFEEYFFRGYFLQATALVSKYKWVPLVLSSVFFGLVHVANPEIAKLGYGFLFFYISLGLFLGIITLMDNGLELSMGFHIANNFFIAFLSSSSWSVFQTPSLLKEVSEPVITPSYILLFYLPLVVVLFIFAKKYQWSNWKEKLLGKIEEKDI